MRIELTNKGFADLHWSGSNSCGINTARVGVSRNKALLRHHTQNRSLERGYKSRQGMSGYPCDAFASDLLSN